MLTQQQLKGRLAAMCATLPCVAKKKRAAQHLLAAQHLHH
jgi:hypothetical protein